MQPHDTNGSGRRALNWIMALCGGVTVGAIGWLVNDHIQLKVSYQEHAGRSVELIETIKRNDTEQRDMMNRIRVLEFQVEALRAERERR